MLYNFPTPGGAGKAPLAWVSPAFPNRPGTRFGCAIWGCFGAGVIGMGRFSAFRSLSTEHLRPSNVSVRASFRLGPYLRAHAFVPSCMGVGAAGDVPFKNDVFPKIELCRRGFSAFSARELRGGAVHLPNTKYSPLRPSATQTPFSGSKTPAQTQTRVPCAI